MTAKEKLGLRSWLPLIIPLVLLIFGGGSWSGVMQYQIVELNKKQAETAKKVSAMERQSFELQKQINENLTRINANILVIANQNGISVPFDNSGHNDIGRDGN